ncbi:MAG: hypothetical protein GY829_02195 [Gammaproteobacteria bacterium]|nr:hypothetical protein [Gammaproteobacteria bacterium]
MLKPIWVVQFIIWVFITQFITNYLFAAEIDNKNFYQDCIGCHESQYKHWQNSDHAKSMAVATESSVVADFNNQSVSHFGQRAKFYRDGTRFMVDISYDDKSVTYAVKYTFGFYPLQQYLVDVGSGKLQVLPFSWDSKPADQDGQRWYHNYSDEEIRPEDRLHWRQPLQNWNGMCADCHSDGLERNYSTENNTFNTKWDNINVGCQSCHGDNKEHSQKSTANKSFSGINPLTINNGHWQFSKDLPTASWHGTKPDNEFMDICFSCHSLRSPLTDGINPEKKFLDQFRPQLLLNPLYYPDGQIKEEVYVYGSFLQSKMYGAGVNCLNCHDKHTMKIKIEGNGLCLQCHKADVFDKVTHHNHPGSNQGAQCINCHMPTTRYMGADDRHDHSFKIPRPELSMQFSTPNACTSCHQDKSNIWARETLSKWNGKAKPISKTRSDFMKLQAGIYINRAKHIAIVEDSNIDVITRATALDLLRYTQEPVKGKWLAKYLSDEVDLIRLAAVTASESVNTEQRVELLSPLLNDPIKAIRIAAAESLVATQTAETDINSFKQAFSELLIANEVSSWRGEGRLNQGMIELRNNESGKAEASFKKAIEIDPYFDSSYVNLADLYRVFQKTDAAEEVYVQGLKKIPKSAVIRYSYGLHLVRTKQLDLAVNEFKLAMKYAPEVVQYAYTYVLALDGQGNTRLAVEKLQVLISNYQDYSQLVELGLSLSQKLQDRTSYDFFARRRN